MDTHGRARMRRDARRPLAQNSPLPYRLVLIALRTSNRLASSLCQLSMLIQPNAKKSAKDAP
eukprot:364934-Chlamydomonas_euryale.AAC.3